MPVLSVFPATIPAKLHDDGFSIIVPPTKVDVAPAKIRERMPATISLGNEEYSRLSPVLRATDNGCPEIFPYYEETPLAKIQVWMRAPPFIRHQTHQGVADNDCSIIFPPTKVGVALAKIRLRMPATISLSKLPGFAQPTTVVPKNFPYYNETPTAKIQVWMPVFTYIPRDPLLRNRRRSP